VRWIAALTSAIAFGGRGLLIGPAPSAAVNRLQWILHTAKFTPGGCVVIGEKLVLLGVLIELGGSASYVWATLAGKAKPNRVTWFLWTVSPAITLAAQLREDVGWPACFTAVGSFIPLLILLASFVNRGNAWVLTKFDIACGVVAAAGIILWQLSGSGTIAILLAIAADCISGVPTFVKSYTKPETENWHVFACSAVSAGITLLTIDTWNFANYGFAAYVFTICVLLVVLISFKPGLAIEYSWNARLSQRKRAHPVVIQK
jgi:hypothetical protein